MLPAFRNQDVFIQRSDTKLKPFAIKKGRFKLTTPAKCTSHAESSEVVEGGQSTNIKKSYNSKRFTSMKSEISVQNNVVNVCCSYLSMLFPYIGNVKYPHRRTYQQFRVVTWYMGSGLKAQNMTGIRAQRRGLRAQKNGIRDHKAFEPKSGIRFITRSKNFLTQYFSA